MSKLKVDELRSADRSVSDSANITLADDGKVGVGTTPSSIFHVDEGSGTSGFLFDSGVRRLKVVGSNSGNGYVSLEVTDQDGSNATSRSLILEPNGGKVGIGTTAPDWLLDIEQGSSVNQTVAEIKTTNTSSTQNTLVITNDSTHSYAGSFVINAKGTSRGFAKINYIPDDTNRTTNRLYGLLSVQNRSASAGEATAISINKNDGGTNIFNVDFNGDVEYVGSITDISDEKLKENIIDATPKLDELLKVKVRNFNFKEGVQTGSEALKKRLGFIAQEIESIWPSLVVDRADYDNNDNLTGTFTKRIRLDVFIPILVQAVQELSAKVTALENK